MLTFADKTRYCLISLYRPIASDDAEVDFLREWKAIAGTIKDQTPKSARRKVGGRDVIEATGTVTVDDGSVVFESVGVIAGDGQVAAMIVFTSNEKTHQACQAEQDAIYASIAFSAAAASPPAAGKAPPSAGLAGTLKGSIAAADLVGSWTFGSSALTSYYSSSTGDYSGASVSFASMTYTFHANGNYEYSESGMSNGSRFHDTYSGTFTVSGGNILLKAKDGQTQTKQLIAFMVVPDTSAVITLYSVYPSGAPLDAAGIASGCYVRDGGYQCTNGELWSRAAATAKAKTK